MSNRRILSPLVLLTAIVVALGPQTLARSQTFTAFDAPDATATVPQSINLFGAVAGYFEPGPQGFVRETAGNFIVFDAPDGFALTGIDGINDLGEVVGTLYRYDSPAVEDTFCGFIREPNGTITVFTAPANGYLLPLLRGGTPEMRPPGGLTLSINDLGEVAGSFFDLNQGIPRGFIRERSGTFTVFDAPNSGGSGGTSVLAMNFEGSVVGLGSAGAFVRDARGNFTVLPGAASVPCGINIEGDVTGFDSEAPSQGFLLDHNGNLTIFEVPDSWGTWAESINDFDYVAGYSHDPSKYGPEHSFIRDSQGNLTTFNAPNNGGTYALSINDLGIATGYFFDNVMGTLRGFVFSLQK